MEVEKSSMDMEFCLDNGVAQRDMFPPIPMRDRGLLNQEESWYCKEGSILVLDLNENQVH